MSFLVNGFWGQLELTLVTTTSPQTFTLPMNPSGYYNATIDWGDGTANSAITAHNDADLAHSYATAGTYTLKVDGAIGSIYFNNAGDRLLVRSVKYYGATRIDSAFWGCTNLNSFDGDLSGITNFSIAWRSCSGLTSFPLLDVSNGTNFNSAWRDCRGLTSFPLLNVNKGTNFGSAWYGCSGLTSFPLLNVNKGTNFFSAWYGCSGLTSFPAGMFDTWTGTPVASCFYLTWDGCSALTATSVENILVSINTSGKSAPAGTATEREITIDYNVATGGLTANTTTAITNLKAKNWTITINGVLQ